MKKKVQKSDDSQQPKFDLCIQVLSVLLLLYDRDNACCSGVGIENQGFKLRPIYNWTEKKTKCGGGYGKRRWEEKKQGDTFLFLF